MGLDHSNVGTVDSNEALLVGVDAQWLRADADFEGLIPYLTHAIECVMGEIS